MRRWRESLLAGMIGLCGLASCDDGGGTQGPPRTTPPPSDPGANSTFLRSLAESVISPLYATLQTDVLALKTAVDAWQAAPDDAAALAAAQAAYQTVMDGWQRAEMLQIGPASSARAGAAQLRDEIYSWPQHNPCRVDQEVAKGSADSADFAASRLVNVYGLDALEYLLYYASGENQCPPQVPPNSDGAWNAMDAAALQSARATYAAAVTAQLVRDLDRLATEWNTFKPQLIDAGQGSTLYSSRQAAYDDVFAAIFYLDLMVKDAKVGDVVGITAGCAAERCPENAESRWQGRDGRNVVENLRAAEWVLFGNGAEGSEGFVALLDARGAGDLAIELRTAMNDALTAAESLDAPFSEMATHRAADLEASYTAIKAVTDLLKTQFVTTLNLSVPQEGAADND